MRQEQDFDTFVAARGRHLLQTAHLLTGDRHAAEELLLTALAGAYLRWDRAASEDPEGYVRGALVAAYISRFRRPPSRAVAAEPPDQSMDQTTTRDGGQAVLPAFGFLPALAVLPRRQRAIVVLRHHEGLSETEIAATLGCSARAVARALGQLERDLAAVPGPGGGADMTAADIDRLLRAPAHALDLPARLAESARLRACRRRLQRRSACAAVAVALAAGGVLLGPGLIDAARRVGNRPAPSAGKTDPRFPAATTEVVTLQSIDGAEILTWFEGADWCTSTTRAIRQSTCLGAVDPEHRGFSWVVPARAPSVTVDNQRVVAGIVPPGASRVLVHMMDGREFEAKLLDGARFPSPVWTALLSEDPPGVVDYYAAFDALGKEIARKKA